VCLGVLSRYIVTTIVNIGLFEVQAVTKALQGRYRALQTETGISAKIPRPRRGRLRLELPPSR
jgi:hypothetical protein